MDQAQPALAWRRIFERLNARLRGHYNYYGVRGNSHSLYRFYTWAINCAFKWLNRRSWRRSYTWEQFGRVIEFVSLARPCITEIPRWRVFA
jgi:RNA-directed DNA polymerase